MARAPVMSFLLVLALALCATADAGARHPRYHGKLPNDGSITIVLGKQRVAVDFTSTDSCGRGIANVFHPYRYSRRFSVDRYRSDYGDDETQGGLTERIQIGGRITAPRATGKVLYAGTLTDPFQPGG